MTSAPHRTATILSLLGCLMIVFGYVALWCVGALFARHPLLIGLQLSAAALMIWARVTFGLRSFNPAANPTAGGLVTTGPYASIRHPIYAALCLFAIAGLANHFSVPAVVCGVAVLGGALLRIFCEERLLVRDYPEYAAYSERTRRLIPGVF